MSAFKSKNHACYATLLLLCGSAAAQAGTLYVHCGASTGLNSIGAALKALKDSEDVGPSTISVSGACHENLLIQNTERLTIAGSNGASITDASGGAADVVDIRNSRVTITGMTIDGLNGFISDGVNCDQGSHCTLLGDTIQGDQAPVFVQALSSALIVGGVLQNGTSVGIFAFGDVVAAGVLIQGNPAGLVVRGGGRATITVLDPGSFPGFAKAQTVVENNGVGVQLNQAELTCRGCIIQANSGDGINADVSAEVQVGLGFFIDGSSIAPSITHNTGHGVYLGDLSSAFFRGGTASTVLLNGQPDIVCISTTSVSRDALTAAGGPAHTNCAN